MSHESMSPRERWLAVLQRRKPDRVPMDYWATAEATRKLLRHLGCADERAMCDRLHIDLPVTVSPRYAGPPIPDDADEFGCRYRDVDYGTGSYRECTHHPLAGYSSVAEIARNYRWPSPDWYDTSVIPGQLAGLERFPVRGGGSEPFLTYKSLRGDEQAFVDLVENPEVAHYILGRLFDLAYENTRRIFETIPGKVMISYVAEDMGGQEDLMISPAQIREFLLPGMRRMIGLVHGAGSYVFHHNDGAVRRIIPDMIEAGIDALNPVQWRCPGMEREALKRDFGDKVVFHGGVDNQQTLPFGTADDVRREVADNLRILGSGGGYILAQCHNIQAVSPVENVVALYETGLELGRNPA
ncbi:MAG: uroporphyrinogen-III decarboxylase-like protein [Deltaproteobacteria bacterium]|nr:uroporphyrinogen-III decarboxylase-like protein [Deltaproteobacteria bacterium]